MTSGDSEIFIRVAQEADARAVRDLDDGAFPLDSPVSKRAGPGELEAGIAAGDVHLIEYRGRVAGYVLADTSRSEQVYISGIAVQPDLQGRGLGGLMVEHVLSGATGRSDEVPLTTVTSPRNIRMLRILFRSGFVARWALRDHFGPRSHRFGFQLSGRCPSDSWATSPGQDYWLPVSALGTIFWLMESRHYIVRSLRSTALGSHLNLVPAVRDGDLAGPGVSHPLGRAG